MQKKDQESLKDLLGTVLKIKAEEEPKKLLDAGFKNIINTEKIIAILNPKNRSLKKLLDSSSMKIINCCGNRACAAIILTAGNIAIKSPLSVGVLCARLYKNEPRDTQE